MRQTIRFFSAVALMLSVGIFSCVAYGEIQLPDEYCVVAGSGAEIERIFRIRGRIAAGRLRA